MIRRRWRWILAILTGLTVVILGVLILLGEQLSSTGRFYYTCWTRDGKEVSFHTVRGDLKREDASKFQRDWVDGQLRVICPDSWPNTVVPFVVAGTPLPSDLGWPWWNDPTPPPTD